MRLVSLVLAMLLLSTPMPAVAADAEGSGPRYEGYLFLDTQNRPLPFQSDSEIEKFLEQVGDGGPPPIGWDEVADVTRLTFDLDDAIRGLTGDDG
jgi:hypothetical protein